MKEIIQKIESVNQFQMLVRANSNDDGIRKLYLYIRILLL